LLASMPGMKQENCGPDHLTGATVLSF